MATRMAVVLVLSSLLLGSTSCVLRGPSGIRREIADATGAEYDREFGLTLGRMSMGVVRCGMKVARNHAGDEVPDISLEGVRKVQVGVYQVKPGTWDADHPKFDPAALGDWESVVRVQDDGEDVHVLLRTKHGETRGMLVVVSEADELVIVRLAGKLDRVIQDALRYGLREVEREDLYEPALEQLEEEEEEPARL